MKPTGPSVRRSVAATVLLAAGLSLPVLPAAAQVTGAEALTQAQSPFQGRPIRQVVLRKPNPAGGEAPAFESLDPSLEQLTRNQLRLLPGAPFDAEALRADLSRLNRLARFRTIDIAGELLADGSMDLVYTLTPQPVITAVQTVGNRRFSDQEILADLDVLVGTPVDRFQLDRAGRFIEDKYRARGYYLAKVEVDEKELESTGAVIFRVREGEKIKVTDIRFEGNQSYSPDELRAAVRTRTAWLLGKGLLDDDRLESDVAGLIDYYRDRGHLSVRADRVVRPSRDGREASVTFVIDEGPVFLLRRVDVFYEDLVSGTFTSERDARAAAKEGEHVLAIGPEEYAVYRMGRFTPEQLAGVMAVKPGDVYSVNRIDQSVALAKDAFAKLGYADLRIERRERRDPATPDVDVLLIIRQGRAFKTGLVEVQGNEITKDAVIRGELEIRPERPVDAGAIARSERGLRDLRLFDHKPDGVKITVQPERPDYPGYRDVLVEVKETNTGEFAIGGAVGSDSGVTGRIALTQRNFDVADTPDSFSDFLSGRAFRGAGQTFSIEALPGSEIQTYSVSLADPTLLDGDFSGSATGFFRDRIYRRYDEQRYGTRLAVGRRLGRRWSLSVPIRLESIDLTNLDDDAPTDVFAVADRNVITSVAITLSRASVDDRISPTTGTSVRLSAEQAGALGGDFEFTTLSSEASLFVPVSEDFLGRRTVLSLTNRIAYSPQGRDEVPIYERFYLGGSSMRGFAFRSIAPIGTRNDTGGTADTTVGGTWLFFTGAELRRPLYADMLHGVVFLDTGTVLFDPGFEDYRVSAGFGFRIKVPALSPVPIALDFGFPLLREDTDRRRLFTFSIDLPF